MKCIDLTRTISANFPGWPNDPPFKLEQIVKQGFVVDNVLQACMHIGTHIDVAQHMIEGGKSLAQYPPEKFMGVGKLIDARGKQTIDVDLLEHANLEPDDIVFVLTGCDATFGTPEYFEKYPIFTQNFANKLVEKKSKLSAWIPLHLTIIPSLFTKYCWETTFI